MSDDFDQFNYDNLTVDEILAEFSPTAVAPPSEPVPSEETPPPAPNRAREKVIPFPGVQLGQTDDDDTDDNDDDEAPEAVVAPEGDEGRTRRIPTVPAPPREKVVAFPEEDNSVTGRIGRLIKHADDYADGMFAQENPDPEEAEREALLPGVDWEDNTQSGVKERKNRRVRLPAPDCAPGDLAKRYGKGLKFLWCRTLLSLLPILALLYLTAAQEAPLPLPALLVPSLQIYVAAGLLGASMLLCLNVMIKGIAGIFLLRWEAETLTALAVLVTLADALTLPQLAPNGDRFPYCVIGAVCLSFAMWGNFLKKRALRQTCRVAAAAGEPYAVTLDERKWNGRDGYSKWSGSVAGYGSQLQAPDGAQRAYHIAAPLLVLAAGLFSLLASVGARHPERILWCLSATLTAVASLSGTLCFAAPFSALSRRLARSGGALGGWDGIRFSRKAVSVVLTDGDLFPPGAIAMNGVKVFGNWDLHQVTAYAATLMHAMGSGLERPFHDSLRSQGGVYRRCTGLLCHEGGATATVDGRQIIVGSAALLTLMRVELPQGLSVKNAAFCAVDGELAGIFALNYALHGTVRPALAALIRGHVSPVLATRDFNVIPAMLRQKFKLPAERMEFPNLDRRLELSALNQEHAPIFAALLCREGLAPFAEAVVGGKRLVAATRLAVSIALLGSIAGLLLAFYLTFLGAHMSLSPINLLLYLLLWTVPTGLVSGWINGY